MDATGSHPETDTDRASPTLIFQPEILSRGEIELLCRRAGVEVAGEAGELTERGLADGNQHAFIGSLQSLGRLAVIGRTAPDFADWPWFSRRPARWAARCVLFFSRFLVSRQTKFNAASLNVLHDFAQQLARLRRIQDASVRRVESRLQEQVDLLETRVAGLQLELTRAQSARGEP
jgi:hypothetical protein